MAFLVIAPWLIRNYLVFNAFVFIRSRSGDLLYTASAFRFGHDPSTILSSVKAEVEAQDIPEFLQTLEETKDLSELELDAYLRRKAIRFIQEYPLFALKMMFYKLIWFWLPYMHYSNFYGERSLLYLLFLLGLLFSLREWKRHILLYSFFLTTSLTFMTFCPLYARQRYHGILFPFELILIASAVNALWAARGNLVQLLPPRLAALRGRHQPPRHPL